MDKVKKLIRAGASIPSAIRLALEPLTVQAFAEKHGRNRNSVSNEINGNVRATDATIDALIAELGGSADEWRELLWLAGKPAPRDAEEPTAVPA